MPRPTDERYAGSWDMTSAQEAPVGQAVKTSSRSLRAREKEGRTDRNATAIPPASLEGKRAMLDLVATYLNQTLAPREVLATPMETSM